MVENNEEREYWERESAKDIPITNEQIMEQTGAPIVLRGHRRLSDFSFRTGYDLGFLDKNNQVAEANFKAGKQEGIREVVEWLQDNHIFTVWDAKTDKLLQAKLKEWEVIKDGRE